MSKKRTGTSAKKRKNTKSSNGSVRSNPRPIIRNIDYTYIPFPSILGSAAPNVSSHLQRLVNENLEEDASFEDLQKEFAKQQMIWNDLSSEEKDKILNKKNLLKDETLNFWENNFSELISYKSVIAKIVNMPSETEISTVIRRVIKQSVRATSGFVVNWGNYLNKCGKEIIKLIGNGASRNLMAGIINQFTVAGLTNKGQSLLNVARTLWLRQGSVPDIIFDYLPKALRFAIKKEKEAILDFTKILNNKSAEKIIEEFKSPSHSSYRYILLGAPMDTSDLEANTNFKIIKDIILVKKEGVNAFVNINISHLDIENKHQEEVSGIRAGERSLKSFRTEEYVGGDTKLIKDNLSYLRNLLLTRKEEFVDVFLNGSERELEFLDYWISANSDKSILSGIYTMREVFLKKDREEIIRSSIDAQIAHNTDLLSLNDKQLLEWLFIGVNEQ